MGNDIARQFAHLPHDDAVRAIAAHLQRFWDPRLRARLRQLVSDGTAGADPRVVEAARRLADSPDGSAGDPAQASESTGG